MTLSKLREIAKRNPWMLDEIIAVIDGKPVTLREAIEEIERGTDFGRRIQDELKKLGYDPVYNLTEEQWQLAYARWSQYPRNMVIYWRNKAWTVDEILKEIRNRTPIGAEFAAMELGFLERVIG